MGRVRFRRFFPKIEMGMHLGMQMGMQKPEKYRL